MSTTGKCGTNASATARDDSTCNHHAGLFITAGTGLHHSSVSSDGGYIFTMGVGYLITSRFSMRLQFYTGDESVAQLSTRPVWGRFLTGGGTLESTLFLSEGEHVRPYAVLGYGLFTILENGLGYNGGGPRLGFGLEADLSSYFSLSLSAYYLPIRFHGLVGAPDSHRPFEAFTDHLLGAATSISFYPNIRP